MIKNLTSILDFGSSRITVLSGVGDVNNSFNLLASVEIEYEGFSRGEFLDSNNLQVSIADVIKRAEEELQSKINNLYIGVPAEFCFVYDAMLTKTFPKKTKITTKIVDGMFIDDKEENPYTSHSVINKAPLFFIVNDDNKTNNPVGLIANKLQARTGYVLVENKFKLLISGILKNLGIKQFDFISSTLAECVGLISEHKRCEGGIVVDCGHITTSVAQVLGSGIKELKSFSLGGGYITSDIAKFLDISFEDAEYLKRQAILTLKPSGLDFYDTKDGRKFAVKTVNEIILNRIDKIVEMIKKCLDGFEMTLPDYIPICITGGGLNYIEGIKDYFRRVLDRDVELVAPKMLLYRKPDLSSSICLLNMAINLYK
ncbi:MAG: rod shape-determining protein [Clostridia bacterium]|nr:rod shape-determining protein [Clostridia bacterium]